VAAAQTGSWFWTDEDRANAKAFGFDERRRGFIAIEARAFEQRSIEQYKALIEKPDEWAKLEAEIDYYFNDRLDPFPYESGIGADRPDRHRDEKRDARHADWLRSFLLPVVGFRLPAEYFEIQLQMIARRFPAKGGHGVDGDIRSYISLLRYIYGKNLWHLIVQRRIGSLVASLLTLFVFAASCWLFGQNVPELPLALQAVAIGSIMASILYIAWWITNYPRLSKDFLSDVQTSCANVGRAVEKRFTYLADLIPHIHHHICHERYDYDDPKNEWPEAAKKWAKLALWMWMRAQYLEFFFQVEMWRMRRMEAWLRLIGYTLSAITLVTMLASLVGLTVWFTVPALSPLNVVFLAASAVCAYVLIHVNWFSYRRNRTGRNVLEKNLGTSILPGFSDTKLHELSAETIASLIKDLLHEETPYDPAGGLGRHRKIRPHDPGSTVEARPKPGTE
jgi:hypothetical protein